MLSDCGEQQMRSADEGSHMTGAGLRKCITTAAGEEAVRLEGLEMAGKEALAYKGNGRTWMNGLGTGLKISPGRLEK